MLSTGERSSSPKPIILAELWRRYERDRDRTARDQLILTYCPLVKQVAGRVAANLASHLVLADLISYGFSGLITAVERFESGRGVAFESYAGLRIRGAIFDELRTMDWVPRTIREEGRRIQQATATLTTRLQRLPRDWELADELSLDADELAAALQRVESSQMVALDRPEQFGGERGQTSTLLDALVDRAAPDPAEVSADAELRDRVAAAVLLLPAREQTVLGLRYHQRLTMGEIAEVLQVTESRISQIHSRAVIELRVLLSDRAVIADSWAQPARAEREALLS